MKSCVSNDCVQCEIDWYLRSIEPTGDSVLSNLSVLHQVHDGQHGGTDACWEDCLGRLQHVVGGRVLRGVLLIWQRGKNGGKKWAKGREAWLSGFLGDLASLTLYAGQRAHRPDGTTAERVVPVGVAGSAGGADRQAARCQVHHFFCWQDQWEETDAITIKINDNK